MSDGSHSPTGLGLDISQQPQSQIDIVDCAVVEDATVFGCIADEETGRVEEIGGLGAYEEGFADTAGSDLSFGGPVRGIETARVAGHDFEVRVLLCKGAYITSL